MDFQVFASRASRILGVVENYQWELGKISNGVISQFGSGKLEELSTEIEKKCGVKRTASSLRMYAHVWKESTKLELPKELMFSTCRSIIFSEDPTRYVKMLNEGKSVGYVKAKVSKEA